MEKKMDELFVLAQRKDDKSEVITAPNYSYWKSVFRVFFSKKSNYVMLGLLAIILLLSFIQPIFSGFAEKLADGSAYTAIGNYSACEFLTPSWEHPFGTADLCVDMWDYVWAGTRTSLLIAFIATIINVTIGIAVGAAWGYSKAVDKVMTEVYNVISNIPFVLFITVMMYIIGSGFWQLIFSLTVTGWVGIAFFIRNQVIIIRDREYNLASKCLGTPVGRMITRNLLPHLTSVIVTLIANEIPSYISYEVFLSYIGVGLTQSIASLGRIIEDNNKYLDDGSKNFVFWIPVAISAVVTITLYVVGQNLADASDPRTHM